MCTNKRWIRNIYNGRQYLVNCGSCESCQNEKSHNVFKRIINTFSSRYDVFMITLTYKNIYIPYIRKSEFGCFPVSIYRDASCKKIRSTTDYKQSRHCVKGTHVVGSFDDVVCDDPKYLKSLNFYDPDKVGVCFYSDVQKYFKRFRQVLIRKYAFSLPFKYFCCSEYGTKKMSFRPHFHILLFFPRGFANVAKGAHFASWHYDSYDRKGKSFEFARKPAKYLSGYLSKSAGLSKFFTSKFIRQKHSYSQGFGASSNIFSLLTLCRKIEENNVTYNMQYFGKDGCPIVRSFLFPRYIANRYFPRFKGDYSLTSTEIYNILKLPLSIKRYSSRLSLTDEDIHKFIVRLRNCVFYFGTQFYSNDPSVSFDVIVQDYARFYVKFWNLYRSALYKRQFDDVEFMDLYQLYDNFADVYTGHISSDLFRLYLGCNLETDPNKFPLIVQRDKQSFQAFMKNRRERELNDSLLSIQKDIY